MASTLTGALSSSDEPAGLNRSDFDASIMFYRGRTGLGTRTASINLLDSSRRMWSIHQPTKCSNRWFRFTGYRAAKQQDSDLAPDSRRAPSGAYDVPPFFQILSPATCHLPPVTRWRKIPPCLSGLQRVKCLWQFFGPCRKVPTRLRLYHQKKVILCQYSGPGYVYKYDPPDALKRA
jgi:hypothetical protein